MGCVWSVRFSAKRDPSLSLSLLDLSSPALSVRACSQSAEIMRVGADSSAVGDERAGGSSAGSPSKVVAGAGRIHSLSPFPPSRTAHGGETLTQRNDEFAFRRLL